MHLILYVNMDEYLSSVYYDPKRAGGLGGVDRLYQDVRKEGKFKISRKKMKEWLMKQDTYTNPCVGTLNETVSS